MLKVTKNNNILNWIEKQRIRFIPVRTEPQFHQNICCKTGQHKDKIIDKLHILSTNIVNYKYNDHQAAMKSLYRNKPLSRNEPLCKNEQNVQWIYKKIDWLKQSWVQIIELQELLNLNWKYLAYSTILMKTTFILSSKTLTQVFVMCVPLAFSVPNQIPQLLFMCFMKK